MPEAVVVLVITGAGGRAGATVIFNVAVPVPPAFVAVMVTVKVPDAVGLPEINPVVALTVKPPGSPVAPKLVGLLVAVIW